MMTNHTTGAASDRAALTAELLTIVTAVWFDIDHGSGAGVSAFSPPTPNCALVRDAFTGPPKSTVSMLRGTQPVRASVGFDMGVSPVSS